MAKRAECRVCWHVTIRRGRYSGADSARHCLFGTRKTGAVPVARVRIRLSSVFGGVVLLAKSKKVKPQELPLPQERVRVVGNEMKEIFFLILIPTFSGGEGAKCVSPALVFFSPRRNNG